MSRFPWVRGTGWLCLPVLCAALAGGCKKAVPSGSSSTEGPSASSGNVAAGDPTPEATLTLAELNKNLDAYKGKWVLVSARVQKIHRQSYPDREEATLDLMDDKGKLAGSANFEAAEWAKAPKIEDGVTYQILGYSKGGKDWLAATLDKCRFVGTVAGGPASGASGIDATVTAKDLAADASRYLGKRVQVKGTVRTGTPATRVPPSAGILILDGGADTKWVTCNLAAGEFDKVLKAGQGCEVEVLGIVAEERPAPSLTGCTVVKATPAGKPGRAVDFTREFARKKADEASFKNRSVTLTGKAEAGGIAGDGTSELVLTGHSDKGKNANPHKVVCRFGPDWKDAVRGVKPGEEVTVSGAFLGYKPGEVTLIDCWLIPK